MLARSAKWPREFQPNTPFKCSDKTAASPTLLRSNFISFDACAALRCTIYRVGRTTSCLIYSQSSLMPRPEDSFQILTRHQGLPYIKHVYPLKTHSRCTNWKIYCVNSCSLSPDRTLSKRSPVSEGRSHDVAQNLTMQIQCPTASGSELQWHKQLMYQRHRRSLRQWALTATVDSSAARTLALPAAAL